MTTAEVWTLHPGTPCPVPRGYPEVLLRDGRILAPTVPGDFYVGEPDWWQHQGHPNDSIVAYRFNAKE